MSDSEKIVVPAWAVTLFKFAAPAILALFATYLKIQSMEQTLNSHSETLNAAEKRCAERDNIIHQLSTTINVLSERQRNLENNTAIILNATNQNIKELREELIRLRDYLLSLNLPRTRGS